MYSIADKLYSFRRWVFIPWPLKLSTTTAATPHTGTRLTVVHLPGSPVRLNSLSDIDKLRGRQVAASVSPGPVPDLGIAERFLAARVCVSFPAVLHGRVQGCVRQETA